MTEQEYEGALARAVEEYERLGAERQRIDDRLSQLAQTISTLMRLLGRVPTVPFGLTDACRLVYRNAGVPLSPTDVRDRLRAIGIDLSVYSNEMAAIHTVLRRLNESGELRALATAGKQSYAWRTPVRAMAIGPEVAQFLRGNGTFDTAPPRRALAGAAKPRRAKPRKNR